MFIPGSQFTGNVVQVIDLKCPVRSRPVSKPLMFGLITYDWQNKGTVVFFFDITNLTCRLIYKLNLNGFNCIFIYTYDILNI